MANTAPALTAPTGPSSTRQARWVLDIVDTRTNRVIWRGWAQDSLEGVLGNHDKMERQIHEAVTRMLQRFPRHSEARTRGSRRCVGCTDRDG